MSLPSLRERIANLKKRKDKDEEERPNHNVDPDEFETPSVCRAANHFSNTSDFKSVISPVLLTSSPKNTEEINDHPSWLAQIKANGNTPEDWLQYTNYVRDNVQFSDKNSRNEYLSNSYARAMKEISPDDCKRNLAYAQLIINFAVFKREHDPEEARSIMTMARINTKCFAIVHITAAQMDLGEGKRDKAKKVLEKAQDFNVHPRELLETALRNLNNGAHVLLSEEDLLKYEELHSLNQPPKRSSPLNHLTDNQIKHLSHKQLSTSNTEDLLQPKKSWTGNVSIGNTTLSELLRPKISARQPDSASTTLEIATTDISLNTSGLQRSKLPQSTSQLMQDVQMKSLSPENEDSVHGHLLFKQPLPAVLRLQTPISTPLAPHRPGEISMSTTYDNTVSFKGESRTRKCSGSNSDDNDTIPFISERKKDNTKTTLKSYHSTPDCTSASVLSSESKKFFGLPRRVKRTSLPQLYDCASGIDDTENIRLDPLPELDSSVDEEAQQRKKSTNSDSGVVSMDHAILESSDEHKPMDTSDGAAGQPHRSLEHMDTGASSLHSSGALHQNINYLRNKSAGNRCISDSSISNKHSTPGAQLKSSQTPLEDQYSRPAPQLQRISPSEGGGSEPPKRQKEVFETPCQKSKHNAEETNPCLLAPTPCYRVPLKAPMVTPMGKQLEVFTINDKYYSVLKTIGRGGSSKVYEVLDESSNLRAIKVVNMEDADDETIASYKNEINLLNRLQYSDRIIKMYDFEYHEETKKLYVVMEKGDTDMAALFKDRNKHGNITEVMRKFYWHEMLQAVQVLQNEGIIHSDLKPPNFMLVAGHLKLIDFGIAKAIQPDHTSAIRDQQVGTLNYISPEAVNDLSEGTQTDEKGNRKPKIKIGVKSDVWSLGCILYNMVYARTPFQKYQSQIQKLQALLNPKCVIDFPDIPDKDLLDVLKRCLKWDPKERPSIDELLNHSYITGKPKEISGLSKESKQRLLQQMAVSSPRTRDAMFDGLLEQLYSGKEIDVNTMLKSRNIDASPQLKTDATRSAIQKSTARHDENIRMVPRVPFQPHNF